MDNNEIEERVRPWAYFSDLLPELAWNEWTKLLLRIGKLKKLDQEYIQLNQNWDESDWYACTIYASMLAICSIYNYPIDECKELIRLARLRAIEKNQFNPKGWAYTINSAITCMEVHNERHKDNMVELFSCSFGSSAMNTLINKNYNLVATYISSQSYEADAADWVLDWTEFNNKQGGHCIRFANWVDSSITERKEIIVLDNYIKKGEFKRYTIPRENILNEVQDKGWSYYPKLYFFIPII